MGNENCIPLAESNELVGQIAKERRFLHHIIGNMGDLRRLRWNGAFGIDQKTKGLVLDRIEGGQLDHTVFSRPNARCLGVIINGTHRTISKNIVTSNLNIHFYAMVGRIAVAIASFSSAFAKAEEIIGLRLYTDRDSKAGIVARL